MKEDSLVSEVINRIKKVGIRVWAKESTGDIISKVQSLKVSEKFKIYQVIYSEELDRRQLGLLSGARIDTIAGRALRLNRNYINLIKRIFKEAKRGAKYSSILKELDKTPVYILHDKLMMLLYGEEKEEKTVDDRIYFCVNRIRDRAPYLANAKKKRILKKLEDIIRLFDN